MVNNSSSSITWDEAFYDDLLIANVESHTNEVNFLKRRMTLDLNPSNNENSAKKSKLLSPILTPPDLRMLGFNTPESEWFELSQPTTIYNIISTPTPSLFPKSVTEEQEMYVQPFIEALQCLHNNNGSNCEPRAKIPMTSSGSNSLEYQMEHQYSESRTSGTSFNIVPLNVIIEEPQTVPSVTSFSLPMSPTNMDSKKKIALERRRQRNRLSASKCRQRKLELNAKLRYNIQELKNENTELTTELNKLLKDICQLKQTVVEHMYIGCEFPTNYCNF